MRNTLAITAAVFVVSIAGTAQAVEFQTSDPLKAFAYGEYPLGDDYFINGNTNTHLFQCPLTKEKNGFDGIALSEISIWGNRTGPWELFRKEGTSGFAYVGTKHLTDTACLETCSSKDYRATGRCQWQRGWPKR